MVRKIIDKISVRYWGVGVVLILLFISAWYLIRQNFVAKMQKREIDISRNLLISNVNVVYRLFASYMEVIDYLNDMDEDLCSSFMPRIPQKKKTIKEVAFVPIGKTPAKSSMRVVFENETPYLYIRLLAKKKKDSFLQMKVDLLGFHERIGLSIKEKPTAYVAIYYKGIYIFHPDETLIGKTVSPLILKGEKEALGTEGKLLKSIHSEYLHVNTYRYYCVLNFGEFSCTFAAGLPHFGMHEIIDEIENSFFIIALVTLFIFIFLLALGVLRWRKESEKRREIEKENLKLELETAQQKKTVIATELQMLKQGLNPHFLFNSLSSLKILVAKKPEIAKVFAISLSNIYRYMLKYEKHNRVSVKAEMLFVNEYINLQKIRFSDHIHYSVDLDTTLDMRLIPPISIQLLVENSVKHTIISEQEPLYINISEQDDYIIVTNNYNPRVSTEDTGGKGLINLEKRYALLTKRICSFSVEHNQFVAKIPLLEK